MSENYLYFDNTMISSYRECPRKFFFRHNNFWTPDGGPAIELAFGLAWHEAMNVIWGGGDVNSAAKRFIEIWEENGLPRPTTDNYQIISQIDERRTPWVAMEMLENYAKQRATFMRDCSSIEMERPFAIPLGLEWRGRKVFYIGRLDKIVSHRTQGRLVIEHKTTAWYAKEGGFRSDYIDSWSPNSQIDGYIFAGNSLYKDGVKGVWVDAALAHKTVHDKFKFIPCDRQFAMMDDWLNDTQMWVSRILADTDKHNEQLRSFPKNTSNCYMYMRPCSFKPVCKYVANPQTISYETPPAGYKIEKWEPFALLGVDKIMEAQSA